RREPHEFVVPPDRDPRSVACAVERASGEGTVALRQVQPSVEHEGAAHCGPVQPAGRTWLRRSRAGAVERAVGQTTTTTAVHGSGQSWRRDGSEPHPSPGHPRDPTLVLIAPDPVGARGDPTPL